jgi:hypothetical protein
MYLKEFLYNKWQMAVTIFSEILESIMDPMDAFDKN